MTGLIHREIWDNFSIQQSFRIWLDAKFSHGIATLFSVTDSSAWINGYRPTDPAPLRLTFPITEQTHLEEFLARSAMGSDVFILFIIISMKESVSYSASFLTISLLISFLLHDAQEFSQMRKLRIWGMSGEKMDGMVAVRWTSVRIRYRKRSRYFVRRFGFKPNLRRLLSLEIIKISG